MRKAARSRLAHVPSATRRNRLAHLAKLLRVPALMQRPFQGQKAPRFTPAQERFDFVKRVVWTVPRLRRWGSVLPAPDQAWESAARVWMMPLFLQFAEFTSKGSANSRALPPQKARLLSHSRNRPEISQSGLTSLFIKRQAPPPASKATQTQAARRPLPGSHYNSGAPRP